LGHVELNEPLLSGTLAALRGPVVLVPLLLGRGYHVKTDLPQALAQAPHLRGVVAAPLGPHPLLADALYRRLREAGWPGSGYGPGPGVASARGGRGESGAVGSGPDVERGGAGSVGLVSAGSGHAVVLAAAGSLSPESAVDTARTAALLSSRLGGVTVLPAYASAASPTVPEAIDELRRAQRAAGSGPGSGLGAGPGPGSGGRIAVASYFTAPGRFATQTSAAAPWIAAAPLGAQEAMARLVLHRYDQAVGTPPGPPVSAPAAARTEALALRR